MKEIEREAYPSPVSEHGFLNEYYVAEGNGARVFIHLQYSPGHDFVQMHLYVEGRNREAVRVMRRDLSAFMTMLREREITQIIGIRPATDDIQKWVHFLLLALQRDFKVADFRYNGADYKVISVEVGNGD